MPILYQIKPMKNIEEITQAELDAMAKHHKLTSYTNDDIAELYNLVRTYINPHISTCNSCSGSLRDAKNQLNSFYLAHKAAIQTRINNPLSEAEQQVEEYKKESKRKKK